MFSKLASKWKSPKPLRVRAYTYTARRRYLKTAEKGALALFKPYKAATSHFTGAIDRFYVRHLFVSYKGVYGRGRAWKAYPHTPPKVSEGTTGCPFSTALYSEYSGRRIIIEERRAWDEEIRVFYGR